MAVTAVFSGCTDPSRPGIRFIAGNGASDTVHAVLAHPLTVQVNDRAGMPAAGVEVRFGELGPESVYIQDALAVGAVGIRLDGRGFIDTTDVRGQASANVRLGSQPGPAQLVVRVPAFSYVDTARFTIRPGNAK